MTPKEKKPINLFIKIILYMPFMVLSIILDLITFCFDKVTYFIMYRIGLDLKESSKGTILEDFYKDLFDKYNERD
jgi:hypothetical protein